MVYKPTGYGAGAGAGARAHTNLKSSTGDFTLRSTISVTTPPVKQKID